MRDYINIGSTPIDEPCAQVGAANYHELSRLELAAFKKGLEEKYKKELDASGASFGIKEGEVVCYFDDEKSQTFAFWLEANTPENWGSLDMKAPRLDDEEFTKAELIDVPVGGVKWNGDVPECQMGGMNATAHDHGPITNEFFDGKVKGFGSWAIMCPACFGMHGCGIGIGLGQRYRKAKDGNFYKHTDHPTGKPKGQRASLDMARVQEAVENDEQVGFCKACGAEQDGVEPDACSYECQACGEKKVYGAAEILMEG